jgi:Purine nucleoside permease (NUP)
MTPRCRKADRADVRAGWCQPCRLLPSSLRPACTAGVVETARSGAIDVPVDVQKILALTSKVDLTGNDNATAQAYRGHYAEAKAKAPPSVIQCDTMAGDTWFHGIKLGERATA